MREHFLTKLGISSKEDLSDFTVLSFFFDLKYKALTKLAECAEPFFTKLYGLIYSQ
jgi:hypothetical protein